MSYVTFGGKEKTPEEIIAAARKQRKAHAATKAVINPLEFATGKITKFAVRGKGEKYIDDETYFDALIKQMLKEQSLYPKEVLDARILKIINKQMAEQAAVDHPYWSSGILKPKNG